MSNAAPVLDWAALLSTARLPGPDRKKEIQGKIDDHRIDHERDFDRVVFSTPVRRLKDKTQVFPLDMHDGVRTRLTHSMEVSNLSRSMGIAIAGRLPELSSLKDANRSVPSLLATIALTHDLGNPPFGHQGEEAIQQWVRDNQEIIKAHATERKFDPVFFLGISCTLRAMRRVFAFLVGFSISTIILACD